MFLRFEATLNGKSFSDIAPEIILRDIVEEPAEMDVTTARWANRPGQRVSAKVRTSLSVRLVYNIRAYDISRRAEIRDLVAEWAVNEGYLTINSRPGKRLYVQADVPPVLDSSLKWTQDLSMTLTAYTVPYWEDIIPVHLPVDTAWAEANNAYYFAGNIRPAGNVPNIPATLMFLNSSDNTPLTHLRVQAGQTYIELSGINISPISFLSISYTSDGLLEIVDTTSHVSLLKHRTPESSDELLLDTGRQNQIIVESDMPVIGNITARGRWI